MSVDFPEPDGPHTTTTSPLATRNDTSLTARIPPKLTETPATSSAAGAGTSASSGAGIGAAAGAGVAVLAAAIAPDSHPDIDPAQPAHLPEQPAGGAQGLHRVPVARHRCPPLGGRRYARPGPREGLGTHEPEDSRAALELSAPENAPRHPQGLSRGHCGKQANLLFWPPLFPVTSRVVNVYGIRNCDTVKKARRWLDDQGIAYRFHDFRSDGLEPARLAFQSSRPTGQPQAHSKYWLEVVWQVGCPGGRPMLELTADEKARVRDAFAASGLKL